MVNKYLRAFVIGSSCFVFFPYFFVVSQFRKGEINYTYRDYTFIAPLFLGLLNVTSLILAESFNLSCRFRFFMTSIVAPLFVTAFAMCFHCYNYKTVSDWGGYVLKLFFLYFFVWNVVVYTIENNM